MPSYIEIYNRNCERIWKAKLIIEKYLNKFFNMI